MSLSEQSAEKLSVTHDKLQFLFEILSLTVPFEVVATKIEKKEYAILKLRGVTALNPYESVFCVAPYPVVAVPYDKNGELNWGLKEAREFRDSVYDKARELGIYIRCGRNMLNYTDILDYKNHFFELISYE